jgi:hypothetical protein
MWYRTNRVVLPDPSPVPLGADPKTRKAYNNAIKDRRQAKEQNEMDSAWLEKLDAEIGDSFELSETEQWWFDYIVSGHVTEDYPE